MRSPVRPGRRLRPWELALLVCAIAAILFAAVWLREPDSSLESPPVLTDRQASSPAPEGPRIFADDAGIHFRRSGARDFILDWGEIAGVDTARRESDDGTSILEIDVGHFSGAEFRFHDVDPGYDQVINAMEQHLLGFSRAKAEAAFPNDQKQENAPPIWKRNEVLQPFQPQHPPGSG